MTDGKQDNIFLENINENLDKLKDKIYDLLNKLEGLGLEQIEAKIAILMQNLMNFFSKFIPEIPEFDSLPEEQKAQINENFKICSHTLITQKVTNIEDLLNIFLYHIFYNMGLNKEVNQSINLQEIIKNKKLQEDFSDYVERSMAFECFKMINPNFTYNQEKEEKFIDNAIIYGVENALKLSGVKQKYEFFDSKTISYLEHAHNKFRAHYKQKSR